MSPSRRKRLRLVLRDLSTTAAFTSIVLTGSVPPWALAAYGVALSTSLIGKRPLAARPTVSVVLLLVTGALLFGAALRGALDLVISACTFAGLVTSHRLLSEPSTGTDQQVHLTSLLMLAGGAALTGELWFGACLATFAVFSTLSLGLSVLDPEGGASEEHLEVRPVLSSISIGAACAIAGAIAFFVLFPRLSWNIAPGARGPGLGGVSGMSDRVVLGGTGEIKSSPRVVARVRFDADPRTDPLDAYFPGRSFDAFDGREWKGTGQPRPARMAIALGGGEVRRKVISQTIELLPGYGSRTLIGMEQPVAFHNALGQSTSGAQRMALVEVGGEEVHFAGGASTYTYGVSSVVDRRPLAALERPERFDQAPQGLDPRVKQLADQVLAGETRPLQAATRLQRYLQREYSYSLELGGDSADPLTDFLFVRKTGHCEHFASALTMLLRSQHIPARVTAGFFGGERLGSTYVLRAGDAHAWTEVFVPGRGWLTVDATPESGRGSQPAALLAWLTDWYEQLQDWWRLRVVDYSFVDQAQFVRELVRPPRGSAQSKISLPSGTRMLAAIGAAIAAYALVQVMGRRVGNRGRRHAATSFLDQIEAQLRKAGVGRLPDEAIEELTARLNQGRHPIAGALTRATRAYLSARFGGARLTAAERSALLASLR